MSDDTTLKVGLEASTGGAEKDFKAVADAVATLGGNLRNIASDMKGAASAADKIERALAGVGTKSGDASKGVDKLTKSLSEQAAAQQAIVSSQFAKVTDNRRGSNGTNVFTEQIADAERLRNTVEKTYEVIDKRAATNKPNATPLTGEGLSIQQATAIFRVQQQQNAETEKAVRLLRDKLAIQSQIYQQASNPAQQARRYAQPKLSSGNSMGFSDLYDQQQQQQAYKEQAVGLTAARKAYQDASDAVGTYRDNLANTRYAIYDVSNTMGIMGAAILAADVGALKLAADYETAFATIERTSGASGDELVKLQNQFEGLAQTIPTSFKDLTSIGALAGQLNISAKNIAEFTKSVAMFTSTTNVGVDSAATAFGRLDALLPDVNGNYEALGSSILNVGVNSVATEAEIVSTTSQIAAAGAAAGLSADQVIGLSASFASLGVAPEASRGTVIRVFGLINKAIAEGGDSLNEYAKIAGVSADEFKKSWGTKGFSDNFVKFLQGIGSEGTTAQLTLADLGITAARDQSALLKLSQNTGLVADNLGYAADGMSDATQLGDSFAITSATLAAKTEELVNSFKVMFGVLGSGGLSIVGNIVDGLKSMVVFFTDLAKNPFVSSLATTIGALSAFSGVIALLTSGFGRFIGSILAAKPVVALFNQQMAVVQTRLAVVKAEAALAGTSMGTFRAATVAASGALKTFAASTGVGLLFVGALMLAGKEFEAISDSMKSTSDRAKETFGSLDGLSKALADDTAAAKKGADAYGHITANMKTVTDATDEWTGYMAPASDGQIRIAHATKNAATEITQSTLAIGANTAAWLANQLATDKSVQELFKLNNATLGGPTLDVGGVLTAAAKNDKASALKIVEEYQAQAQEYMRQNGTSGSAMVAKQYSDVAEQARNAIDSTTGALQTAANQTVINTSVNDALGVSAQQTTDALLTEGDGAETAADKLSQLQDQVAAGFANTNALADMAKGFFDLSTSIYQGGVSFDAFSQGGQANLANLQGSIATTIAAGATMGVDATESIGILFHNLQQQGIDTAQLLASVTAMGYNAKTVQGYVDGTIKMSAQGKYLAEVQQALTQYSHDVADSLAGSGGGGGGGGTPSVADAAKDAAKEIRTLSDYASDLHKVFDRAYELRFGKSDGLDDIASGWNAIAKSTADANKEIADAQNKLRSLTADKSTQQYLLGVANQYGDKERAGQLGASIADLNSQIADEQQKVTDAQADNSKTLKGNTQQAIDNRQTLGDMVGKYKDYIGTLAESGMSQEDLKKKSGQLKQEFISQATQAGYSKDEIKKYSDSFDDMTEVIGKVPRKVTVNTTANTSPAKQALKEFEAQAKASGTTAGRNFRNAVSSAIGGGGKPISFPKLPNPPKLPSIPIHFQMPPYRKMMEMQDAIRKTTGDAQFRIALGPGSQGGQVFMSGGYTGGTSTKDIVGSVHGKEYVIDAENTKRLGLPFLNALNNGMMPNSTVAAAGSKGGGSGVMVVELSPYDRQLLAQAGNVQLKIGNKTIAAAASSANVVEGRRRSN